MTPQECALRHGLIYFDLRAGKYRWSANQTDAFLNNLKNACSTAGLSVRAVLEAAASAVRGDLA